MDRRARYAGAAKAHRGDSSGPERLHSLPRRRRAGRQPVGLHRPASAARVMATDRQWPGGPSITETANADRQWPGGPNVTETSGGGGGGGSYTVAVIKHTHHDFDIDRP